ncbi:response regulator [Rubellicoccus peritrichatus]|uniref:Response regulator n=1 Tax=Rubellicoccus peritrichatus TaxID=3080537 RepID=A0AAQ3LD04_9BACT|nr:response regulator [Puniceicoccus sp. CR14]WOO41650.1 response regulator [Puniceicoccus sp. CR14]
MSQPVVLIVEDNSILRDMVSRRLRRRGYSIVTASDGELGLTAAQIQKPDIILLDMSLPGMDGWSVATKLKSDDETQAIPLIALTAHAMQGDRERALAAGCDDYESKPINFISLIKKMDLLMGREASGD